MSVSLTNKDGKVSLGYVSGNGILALDDGTVNISSGINESDLTENLRNKINDITSISTDLSELSTTVNNISEDITTINDSIDSINQTIVNINNGTTTNVNNVLVTNDNSNATYYPTFVANSESGEKSLFMDSTLNPLSYNPSTGNLSSTTFTGNLSGTATNATNVTLASDNSFTGAYYIPLAKSVGTGNKQLYIDVSGSTLAYNPNAKEINVSRITPNAADEHARLTLIERCLVTRIQSYGFSISNATFATSANTNYAFYCGNDGQNNFNAPSQAVSGNTNSKINFCISDVKYMNINGTTARLGNVGIRNADPDHPLDVTGNIRSTTSVLTPQVGNPSGNLDIRVNGSGAGGTLSFTGGSNLISENAGNHSGNHLCITVNGVAYKIALLNA